MNPGTHRSATWAGAFLPGASHAVLGTTLGRQSAHPDYEAAKGGDVEAAVRMVRDLVDEQLVDGLRARLPAEVPPSEIIVLPVTAIEARGFNPIPRVVATALAIGLGAAAGSGVVQMERIGRTALAGLDRLFAQPSFSGPILPGRAYVLVDDTLTQGGTFASLASHVAAGGGHVAACFALSGKGYSARLLPSPEQIAALRVRFSDVEPSFEQATGYGFDGLTESEARYLAKFDDAQRVRDRVAQACRRPGQPEGLGIAEVQEALSLLASPCDPPEPSCETQQAIEALRSAHSRPAQRSSPQVG